MTIQQRHYLLVPDRHAGWKVRRALAEGQPMLGVRVLTWPELLEELRRTYLLPVPESNLLVTLADAAAAMESAFWAESLHVAQGETDGLLAAELTALLEAAGPPGRIETPPKSSALSDRGQRHLRELSQLHDAMGYALPDELALMQALLETPLDSGTSYPIIYTVPDLPRLSPWQTALLGHIESPATDRAPGLEEELSRALLPTPGAPQESLLAAVQADPFTAKPSSHSPDETLQWIEVRDALAEVEVCAGMIQQALQADASCLPSDIALLLPAGGSYEPLVASVFGRAGLPLAGLSIPEPRVDVGRELILNYLQACRHPSPRMAVAALVTHPFMPWGAETGHRLAEDALGGDLTFRSVAKELDQGDLESLLSLRRGINTPKALRTALERLAALPALAEPDPEGAIPHRRRALEALQVVKSLLAGGRGLDWAALLSMVQPERLSAQYDLPATREGIAVFVERHEPWREVRHLLVLGFAEGNYPTSVAASSVFAGTDREALATILPGLETPAASQRRLRALFTRQLAVARSSVTFLSPHVDGAGGRLHPSASLSFMARFVEGTVEPEDLLLAPDRLEDRAQIRWLAQAQPAEPEPPRVLEARDLRLKRNLLEVGRPHQSPSGLETLLVSPLGWLLEQAGLTSSAWAPEDGSDILLQGTLAHEVFEHLFSGGGTSVKPAQIEKQAQTLLLQAIGRLAPFMERPEWHVEVSNLAADISRAALQWNRFLDESGAEVVKAEAWLAGYLDDLMLRGKSDAILRLPDGRLYVVDYKKSGSGKRRDRMSKAFDLQAHLYRIMLETGPAAGVIDDPALLELLGPQPEIGVMYYLLNDRQALADSPGWLGAGLAGVQEMGTDVSKEAMVLLRKRLEAVRKGQVELNREGDEDYYDKRGVGFYVYGNHPLVARFLKPMEDA